MKQGVKELACSTNLLLYSTSYWLPHKGPSAELDSQGSYT